MSTSDGPPPRAGLAGTLLHSVLTQIVSAGVTMAVGIAVARTLGPSGKGVLTVVVADAQLLALVLGLNTSGIIFFLAQKRMSVERLLGFFSLYLGLGALLALGGVAYLGRDGGRIAIVPAEVAEYGWMIVALFVLSSAVDILLTVFRGMGQMSRANNLLFGITVLDGVILGSVLLVAGATGEPAGVITVLHAMLASGALKVGVCWAWYRKAGWGLPSLGWDGAVAGLFKFSGLGFLGDFVNFLNYRLDIWIVQYYCGPAELGLYALAVGLAQMIWLVAGPIHMVIYQRIAAADGDGRDDIALAAQVSRLVTLPAALAGLAGFLLADWVIPRIFGPEFAGASAPFKVLVFGTTAATLTKVWAGVVAGKGFPHLNVAATILGLIFTLSLDFLLIPPYGRLGASVATTASYCAICAFVAGTLRLKLGVKLPDLLVPRWEDWRPVLSLVRGRY